MVHPLWTNVIPLFRPRPPLEAMLAKLPLFSGLSGRQLREVERIVHTRTYRAGEVIFEAGDAGVAMYVIMMGQVDIVLRRTVPEADVRLATLGEGELFGEMALLDAMPRSATAIVAVPTELAAIARPDWMDLIDRHPACGVTMLLALSRMLAARLRVATQLPRKEENEAEGSGG